MDLKLLGWNDFFAEAFAMLPESGLSPARVIAEHRGGYAIVSEHGELAAEVAGRFRHDALSAGSFPAVGDWVAVQPYLDEEKAIVRAVLPRKTKFSRTAAGDAGEEQVLAANIDDVFVVEALGGEVNLRRIERYLTLAWESGAQPTVVLTKADLCLDIAGMVRAVEGIAGLARVIAVSSITGLGMEQFDACLAPARTAALLGPSGVGKSTLINHWCGEELLDVQPVREDDQKGRHTTTHRELIWLPSGACVIDTPGMRELQLWEGAEGLEEVFADIDEIAAGCRFTDCRHESEPDCAVRNAVETGALDAARLESHRKLKREMEHFERKHDKRAQAEQRRAIKSIMKGVRTFYKQQPKKT